MVRMEDNATNRRDRATVQTLEALSGERVLDQREGEGHDLRQAVADIMTKPRAQRL